MSDPGWKPTEETWGERAYREIMSAYPDRIRNRSVALCVWCFLRDPKMSPEQIEAQAHSDPVIRADGEETTSSQARSAARKILGLRTTRKKRASAMKSKKETKLTKTQKAILARLEHSTALYEKYEQAARQLAKAQEDFEKARETLKTIDADHVETIAEADPDAAQLFRELGLLHEENAPVEPESTPVDPVSTPVEPVSTPVHTTSPADPWPQSDSDHHG